VIDSQNNTELSRTVLTAMIELSSAAPGRAQAGLPIDMQCAATIENPVAAAAARCAIEANRDGRFSHAQPLECGLWQPGRHMRVHDQGFEWRERIETKKLLDQRKHARRGPGPAANWQPGKEPGTDVQRFTGKLRIRDASDTIPVLVGPRTSGLVAASLLVKSTLLATDVSKGTFTSKNVRESSLN